MGKSLAVILALGLAALLGPSGVQVSPAAHAASVRDAVSREPSGAALAEHRYRIIGKVRLAFVWVARDDVGSARMTWRSNGTTSALTFLVGSNPGRAPRNLNEWSYLREEVRSDGADVFALGRLDVDAVVDPGDVRGGGAIFGVSCASFRQQDVRSTQTTIDARGATYWMFDRLLEQIAASSGWQQRRFARPAGASAGFLTALQQALRLGRSDAGALAAAPPWVYVYNGAIYDLLVRDSRNLGRTTVGTRSYDSLIRTDFTIRNRTTGDISRFAVTYAPELDGPSLPVQIFYQPSFWVCIELRLDDAAAVPADPSADRTILTRIRAICAGASRD
jgi:hypothetical protein